MRRAARARVLALALAPAAMALASAAVADGHDDGAPELTLQVKPLRAEIGDRVRVELEIVVPAGLAVGAPLFPSWGESWGETEILAAEQPVAEPAEAGATRFRQTLTVIPWRTGELTLQSPVVEIPTATEILQISAAKPVVLDVGSVLPEGEEQPAPKPPAPPLPLPLSDAFWWTLAIAATACLAAAIVLLLQRRAAIDAENPGQVDPTAAFRGALADLDAAEDPLALIAELSLALRRYLGARLSFGAVESTTTEIRRRLQARELPTALVLGVDRLLKHCDAIKFARRPIERDACAGPLAEAATIADLLEEHLTPPPEAGDTERLEAA